MQRNRLSGSGIEIRNLTLWESSDGTVDSFSLQNLHHDYTEVMSDAGFGNKRIAISQRRYLGSKTKLLGFIESVLEKEKVEYSSFADLFAGTGVVAKYFNRKSHVIVNDILESNYQSYLAFFGDQKIRLRWLEERLNQYNQLEVSKLPQNYFSKNFSNTYFDPLNSKKIGFIREDIEALFQAREINKRERAYLITCLIYALDRIANTVGHYDAYRKIDIVARDLKLSPLDIQAAEQGATVYRKDANELVREIKTDVAYIDPPYNSRQYSDAYHLLENIASWEKRAVHGVAKKIDRYHLKSNYSLKSAANAFSDLINNLDAKFILISYNDMGTSGNARSHSRMSDHEIISALERKGKVTIYEKSFNQFTTGLSKKDDLKERIFFCRVEPNRAVRPSIAGSERNRHLPEFIKSPLNYTGGKHKLLPQIKPLFPKDIATFYDVFCGGANVAINAEAKKIVCIDKNPQVIQLLKFIQKTNFEVLNQELIGIIERFGLSQSYINGYEMYGSESTTGLGSFNKTGFQNLRYAYNSQDKSSKDLLLLTLILYSFNNQIRFNSKGEFNLPVGKRDYNGSSRKNLSNFNSVSNLRNISFRKGDFRDLDTMVFEENDFIYLDPPYLLGLASYNEAGGWSDSDERDLYTTLSNLHARHVRFALSNVTHHKGQANRLLLDWAVKNKFKINPIEQTYRNSNYQSKAKDNVTKEVLVTNY
jgi:adenine-specific DNA-methyltransferase